MLVNQPSFLYNQINSVALNKKIKILSNSLKMLSISIFIIGTIITLMSNSWLELDLSLEINLFSYIPPIGDSNNLKSTESSLNYFLTQALAWTVLLFSVMLLIINSNFNKYFFISSIIIST